MTLTTVEVLPDFQVLITHGDIVYTLAPSLVAAAAAALRRAMLEATPVVVPCGQAGCPCVPPKCKHTSIVNTSAGPFCEDCGAEV